MELTYIKTFHQSKYIDTKVLVQKMMPKFYEYIMASELAVHTKTPQILVRNNEDSLYFNNNPNRMHSLLSEATILERICAEFVIYQNMVSGRDMTDDCDVLDWFQIQKIQFSMLRALHTLFIPSPLRKLKMEETSHLQASILHRAVPISL